MKRAIVIVVFVLAMVAVVVTAKPAAAFPRCFSCQISGGLFNCIPSSIGDTWQVCWGGSNYGCFLEYPCSLSHCDKGVSVDPVAFYRTDAWLNDPEFAGRIREATGDDVLSGAVGQMQMMLRKMSKGHSPKGDFRAAAMKMGEGGVVLRSDFHRSAAGVWEIRVVPQVNGKTVRLRLKADRLVISEDHWVIYGKRGVIATGTVKAGKEAV